MNVDEELKSERKQAVPSPGLLFICPHCEAQNAVASGMKGVAAISAGHRIHLVCSTCKGEVELWRGERPRIVTPADGPNRTQRRAEASRRRRTIIAT